MKVNQNCININRERSGSKKIKLRIIFVSDTLINPVTLSQKNKRQGAQKKCK